MAYGARHTIPRFVIFTNRRLVQAAGFTQFQRMKKQAPATKAPAAKKTAVPAKRKPRADKGKKHTPGAGRPVGTGKVVNSGLHGRIANLDAWLTREKDVIKAAGIAKAAKLTARVLQSMREGSRVLSEAEIASLESASKPRGYSPAKVY